MQNKNTVKDKQACVSREKGYALITTMFLMVSFLSLAFVLFHPLAHEVQNDSGLHMVDRNTYRFRKALFGETVDQCGTKLVHCGGMYSDNTETGAGGTSSTRCQRMIWARTYGTSYFLASISSDSSTGYVDLPTDYHFNEDNFWSGYLGKGYVYALPSDNWKYDTWFGRTATTYYGYESAYRPFYQEYAHHRLSTGCNSVLLGHSLYSDYALVRGLRCSDSYGDFSELRIVLYDYSEERDNHSLRLVITGSKNARNNMYLTHDDLTTGSTNSYKRLVYWQTMDSRGFRSMSSTTGQRKLIIQVRENTGDPWVTRDTRVICPSASGDAGAGAKRIFKVNFYG